MNYLAHVFLAEDNYESRVGNFLGDFVKGRLKTQYSPGILKGIKTHRKVDVFTDSHEIIKNSRRFVSPERRRWAGVILDIIFDHFLSKHWSEFSNVDLDDFISRFYNDLRKFNNSEYNNLDFDFEKIVRKDWISKYRDIEGLEFVFMRLSKRVRVDNPLEGSQHELLDNYTELEENFLIFFPELIEYVEEVRETI